MLQVCTSCVVCILGYNIDTPTNDTIAKEFGPNACAGCVAMGNDVGIGMVGEAAPEPANEIEVIIDCFCQFYNCQFMH